MKRTLISIFLIPALIVLVFLGVWIPSLVNFVLGPINEPGYFCGTADPRPLPNLGASIVLQECAAGTSVTVNDGATIAVDLQNLYGADTSDQWHDLATSDNSVLATVVSPSSRGIRPRSDEVAVYRTVKVGRSTISAVLQHNGGAGGHRRAISGA